MIINQLGWMRAWVGLIRFVSEIFFQVVGVFFKGGGALQDGCSILTAYIIHKYKTWKIFLVFFKSIFDYISDKGN